MSYLILVNVSLALFAGFYFAFLRRLTFFHVNRIYLLVALGVSIILPAIDVPNEVVSSISAASVIMPQLTLSESAVQTSFPWFELLMQLYWIGVVLGSVRLLISLVLILRTKYRSQNNYLSEDIGHAFSFFKHIHIGEGIDAELRAMIQKHEDVHVSQWHSLDVILFEVASTFFWFNPFLYLLTKEVKQNHEFIADEELMNLYGTDYQYSLLNEALSTNSFRLANSFFSISTIKNRILMMNKMKSNKWSKLTYLFIVPICAGMLWMSACTQQPGIPQVNQTDREVSQSIESAASTSYLNAKEVDVIPEFPGGKEAMWEYFGEQFKYPKELSEAGVEGRVVISFVVAEDGALSDWEGVESDDDRLEGPAIDFLKEMPKWNPGTKDGEAVKVKIMLPVMYSLED